MASSFKYPDIFYHLAQGVLGKHPEIKHQWVLNTKKRRRELLIPKNEDTGFDVGVYCETYGLYPWAGKLWSGPCWDINTPETSLEEMSEEVLGLLRILLSSESRLRTIWKGDQVGRFFLEFATPTGWHVHDKHFVNPFALFGDKQEVICQNSHLNRRSNFNGADVQWFKHYKWSD